MVVCYIHHRWLCGVFMIGNTSIVPLSCVIILMALMLYRELALRTELHKALTGRHGLGFRRRWQRALNLRDVDEKKWIGRWNELVKQTSLTPTINPGGNRKFEYLEQLHVFLLAHILRRPIIVYADNVVRDSKGKTRTTLASMRLLIINWCVAQVILFIHLKVLMQ
jgi:hypothetical protein